MLTTPDTFTAVVALSEIVMKGISDRVQADKTHNQPMIPCSVRMLCATARRQFLDDSPIFPRGSFIGSLERSLFSTKCGPGD
jgi:hypothetical protein